MLLGDFMILLMFVERLFVILQLINVNIKYLRQPAITNLALAASVVTSPWNSQRVY